MIGSPWTPADGSGRLWWIGETALIARTHSGEVIALHGEEGAAIPIGTSAPDRTAHGVRVVVRPDHAAAAILLRDEDAVIFHDGHGPAVRRPLALFSEPAAAYSPGGGRFAVGLAGRRLLVLTGPEDPGSELVLPEDVRGVDFIDEHELMVVGEMGALIRVDLAVGEAVVLRRGWVPWPFEPTRVHAAADGETVALGPSGFFVHPPSAVPRDCQGLTAWLTPVIP